MSTVVSLVRLPTSDAVDSAEGETEEIAHANDWAPLGWLALYSDATCEARLNRLHYRSTGSLRQFSLDESLLGIQVVIT